MQVNMIPPYDSSDNPTGCCPRFNPQGWEGRHLQFQNKLFVRVTTWSIFHIPLNIGSVFEQTFKDIEAVGAYDENNFIVLSRDLSPWISEHYFAVSKDVPGHDVRRLTGNYLTKVFEGPFKNAPTWHNEMKAYVKSEGNEADKIYFFYTTCPKCVKYYGKNYVVAVAKTES